MQISLQHDSVWSLATQTQRIWKEFSRFATKEGELKNFGNKKAGCSLIYVNSKLFRWHWSDSLLDPCYCKDLMFPYWPDKQHQPFNRIKHTAVQLFLRGSVCDTCHIITQINLQNIQCNIQLFVAFYSNTKGLSNCRSVTVHLSILNHGTLGFIPDSLWFCTPC